MSGKNVRNQKSRRQSRSMREDTARLWRDGKYDENAPELQRWSREAKTQGAKVKKVIDPQGEKLGTVMEVNRKTCKIMDKSGAIKNCQLFKTLDLSEYSNLAVGDRVYYNTEEGKSGIIIKLCPRQNMVYRMGPQDRKFNRIVLAANVDRIVIVLSMMDPDFNGKLLDRFLVRVNGINVEKIICLNKADLSDVTPVEVEYLKKLGWEFQFISASRGTGTQDFWEKIKGQKNVLLGPSGVGKSSIVNLFLQEKDVKIQDVRESDGRGRHTTTRSNAYICSDKTWIIDTPGIRELTVWDLESSEIHAFFSEFSEKNSGECQFRNCTHLYEEGCSVMAGVDQGLIPEFRYESYRRIMENSQRNQ